VFDIQMFDLYQKMYIFKAIGHLYL